MILTIDNLLIQYQDYADPYGKIARELKNKRLFTVNKGLYETKSDTPGHYLSAYIYGPSYLSFEYALAYHGLILEKVTVFASATFEKRKAKTYQNIFGVYTYRDIPKSAYPFGIIVKIENNYSFFIATKEKAICDQLYTYPPVHSIKALKYLLFDDLRIDYEAFIQLISYAFIDLCDKYQSTNIKLLKRYLLKEQKRSQL